MSDPDQPLPERTPEWLAQMAYNAAQDWRNYTTYLEGQWRRWVNQPSRVELLGLVVIALSRRTEARGAGDYAAADELRDAINAAGFNVQDAVDGRAPHIALSEVFAQVDSTEEDTKVELLRAALNRLSDRAIQQAEGSVVSTRAAHSLLRTDQVS